MLKKIQTWIDNITTGVAAVMIAVMFVVIIANVILRAIPAVGGFKWYMELLVIMEEISGKSKSSIISLVY